jgi:hypothetical protein
MEKKDFIIKEKDGRFGLSLTNGQEITPVVYDEILEKENEYLCRIWKNLDSVDISTGKVSERRRTGDCFDSYSYWGHEVKFDGQYSERKRNIRSEDVGGYTIVYGENGKFGVMGKDGQIILPCEYDELSKWGIGNVFEARKGNKWFYFDTSGKEILTDCPDLCWNDLRYTCSHWNNNIMQVKECVPELSDNHTYSTENGLFIRLQNMLPKDCRRMLVKHCEHIKIPLGALKLLTDRYSYEFAGYIVTVPITNVITDGLALLEKMGSFRNSWYYIDKFLTNKKTFMKLQDFIRLNRYYADKQNVQVLGDPSIGYGYDNSLSDGLVRWIHIQHYNEHCFPGYYEVGGLVCEGHFDELKEYVESIHWDQDEPFGGEFFNFGNIRYTTKRNWHETFKVLNYLLEHGCNPTKMLSEAVDNMIYFSDHESLKELQFNYNCIKWALSKGAAPNHIESGKSLLDHILADDHSFKTPQAIASRDKLVALMRAHGALTKEELRQQEDEEVAKLDIHDYSIVNRDYGISTYRTH